MVRLLAISDIHGALPAARELVRTEGRDYDALIVAGDIGGDRAKGFFETVTGLGCPVLYVYGNWDQQLAYDESFGETCIHLHQSNFVIGDLLICGFSGCSFLWGHNPIWLEIEADLKRLHPGLHDALAAARETDCLNVAAIAEWYESTLAEIESRAKDRRRRSY